MQSGSLVDGELFRVEVAGVEGLQVTRMEYRHLPGGDGAYYSVAAIRFSTSATTDAIAGDKTRSIERRGESVTAGVSRCRTATSSFDYLVGADHDGWRDGEAEFLAGLLRHSAISCMARSKLASIALLQDHRNRASNRLDTNVAPCTVRWLLSK
jgi:hypothetical protein